MAPNGNSSTINFYVRATKWSQQYHYRQFDTYSFKKLDCFRNYKLTCNSYKTYYPLKHKIST